MWILQRIESKNKQKIDSWQKKCYCNYDNSNNFFIHHKTLKFNDKLMKQMFSHVKPIREDLIESFFSING